MIMLGYQANDYRQFVQELINTGWVEIVGQIYHLTDAGHEVRQRAEAEIQQIDTLAQQICERLQTH